MKLLVCEKPKVAEKIAEALGHGKVAKKGLYGVSYYEVERGGEKLVIVSAVGHLYTLRQGEKGRGYPVFDIEWAPTYEVDKKADYTKKYLDAISKLHSGADEYVCACDFDVEGSLIGYNVIRFACGANGGSRMKFSALTDEELEEAYEKRGPLDLHNALAGEARHMLDWFYGINLSRALMASMRSAGANQVMSIGRVQGPALSILAKKEKEISAFISSPYWELSCSGKGVRFLHARGRFQKKEEAQSALAASGTPGTVQAIEKREYVQMPQPPFDLTSLQVEAYRTFGFAPALTLELAQSLYEASLISYPRTSSQKLPAKLNLKKIIEQLAKNPQYAKPASELLARGRTVPLEGKKDDAAHPAIHPTGLAGQAGEREGKLYNLIARRFLSCFGEAARREAQKATVLSGKENYCASGNRTVFPGWFEIYGQYAKTEETLLPPFSEGEQVPLSDFRMDEKKTQPPKRYTPASIVSELEKLGLGTKATRASIVETLFKRGYLDGKSIAVTPFGMAVHEMLGRFAPEILDSELTRGIEDEMERIQDGENEKKALDDGRQLLTKILGKFDGNEKEIGLSLPAGLRKKSVGENLLGPCPKCGKGDLRIIKGSSGRQFIGCTGYPACTALYGLPQGVKIVPALKACPRCGTPMIRGLRGKGFSFEICPDPKCKGDDDSAHGAAAFTTTGAAQAIPAQANPAMAPLASTKAVVEEKEPSPGQKSVEAGTAMPPKPPSAAAARVIESGGKKMAAPEAAPAGHPAKKRAAARKKADGKTGGKK